MDLGLQEGVAEVTRKSFGLDGFNMSFYMACWDMVKDDLLRVVNEFYRVARGLKLLRRISLY